MKHTTTQVRGASDTEGNGADDELAAFAQTVIETKYATAEVRGTKAIPRATESTTSRPLSRRR